MTTPTFLLSLPAGRYEAFGEEIRQLARRVHERDPDTGGIPDPVIGDPESGRNWLVAKGVTVDPGVKGVPIYAQTMEHPCIMLPPWELVTSPNPPGGYTFPEFYCNQCAIGGNTQPPPFSSTFYLSRLTDYTLSHCG